MEGKSDPKAGLRVRMPSPSPAGRRGGYLGLLPGTYDELLL